MGQVSGVPGSQLPPAFGASNQSQQRQAAPQVKADAAVAPPSGTAQSSLILSDFVNPDFANKQDLARAALLGVNLTSIPDSSDSLSDFIALKQGSLDQRFQAVNIDPQVVGLRAYLIGMMGMLYDQSNQDAGLMQNIINQLLSYSVRGQDLVLLGPILQSIQPQVVALPEAALVQIEAQIQESGLLQIANVQIQQAAQALLDTIALQKATILPASIPQVIQGPVAAKDAEDLRVQLFMGLLQMRMITTIFTENPKNAWVMLYTSFLGIETNITALEEDSLPLIPSEVGLLIESDAFVSPRWQGMIAIQTIRDMIGSLFTVEDIVEKVKFLYRHQFQRVISLMPHSRFSAGLELVQHASEEMSHPLKLVDTLTFGPAYGYLIDHIAFGIYRTGVQRQADGLIGQMIERYRYWVVPQYSVLAAHAWFKLLPKRRQVKSNLYPVVQMHEDPACIQAMGSTEEAVYYVEQLVQHAMLSGVSYHEIVIGYKSHYRTAVELLSHLERDFPSLSIQVVHAGDTVGDYWGDHVSVALI